MVRLYACLTYRYKDVPVPNIIIMDAINKVNINGTTYLIDSRNAEKVNNYSIVVVTSMPASPDEDTIYIVK